MCRAPAGQDLGADGHLPGLSREEAKEAIEGRWWQGERPGVEEDELGGGGEEAALKLAKAQELGIPVLDEAGLRLLLSAPSAGLRPRPVPMQRQARTLHLSPDQSKMGGRRGGTKFVEDGDARLLQPSPR